MRADFFPYGKNRASLSDLAFILPVREEMTPPIRDPRALGAAVRERRRALGLTQEHVAGVARTGTRFIGDLEAGKPTVQLAEVLRVLAALGLDLELRSR